MALAVACAVLTGGYWLMHRAALRRTSAAAAASPRIPLFAGDTRVHAPDGTRVTVELLNASHVAGLARRGTLYLRDRGFDVVLSGTTPEQHDTTVVVDRAHHADWAERAARALGHARVEEAPDSSHDVDLTVLLGASWRPPVKPFYP